MATSEMNHRKSRGFTLLEVMLALALASVLLAAVSSAIDIYLRLLDTGRTQVEEAQLARALLSQIADDLRSAVPYDVKAGGSTAGGESDSLGTGEGGSAAGSDPASGSSGSSDSSNTSDPLAAESPADLTASDVAESVPGLYGNSSQLQIDVYRIPKIDHGSAATASSDSSGTATGATQDSASADATLSTDSLSDVRTVSYYVLDEAATTAAASSTNQSSGGLFRSELDRATAMSADTAMAVDGAAADAEPLAPEVAAIQFQYTDGTEWYETWDSAEHGSLPSAVQITVAIVPSSQRNRATNSASEGGLLLYNLTVQLPLTKAVDIDLGEAMAAAPAAGTGGANSGATGGPPADSSGGGSGDMGGGGSSGGGPGGPGGGRPGGRDGGRDGGRAGGRDGGGPGGRDGGGPGGGGPGGGQGGRDGGGRPGGGQGGRDGGGQGGRDGGGQGGRDGGGPGGRAGGGQGGRDDGGQGNRDNGRSGGRNGGGRNGGGGVRNGGGNGQGGGRSR